MSAFHPLIQSWFGETFGQPTPVQKEAWPRLLAGEHVLALAPTGSGKTLTAFLAALSHFARGTYPVGELSVLYVSPLKALNEDISRNLLEPLASLGRWFQGKGAVFPAVRVETRSGDTPPAKRRRFLEAPPEILAVTPESLAILLLNPRGRLALSTVKYLILDEIHAELGTKRGAFLACQVDRLALFAGEFQRVGLSATVRPAEAAAEFLGGLKPREKGYEIRPIAIVSPAAEKELDLQVDFPDPDSNTAQAAAPGETAGEAEPRVDRFGPRYTILVNRVLESIRAHRTVLVFTDSRQRAERIALLVNRQTEGEQLAWAHHGSLSREVRYAIERRLAEGTLPCVVATSSLELGIDIGSVDEVILAGTPGSSAQTLQRVGRAGHQVGAVSRGRILPFHGLDLLQAAAAAGAVAAREIEETRPIKNPLDILAQVILELCTEKNWNVDDLYDTLRGFFVFSTLPRPAFDGVIRMLTGYYADPAAETRQGRGSPPASRVRELKNRIYLDRETGELTPAPGLRMTLYISGGVIANRGYFSLRMADGVKIGELDEEFVWERRLGDNFEFGSRSWIITAIGAEAVTVIPHGQLSDFAPFFHADTVFRSPVLVRRILEYTGSFAASGESAPAREAKDLTGAAQRALASFLENQRDAQIGTPLPGPDHIPIEIVDDPVSRPDSRPVILHTLRGGAVNYPLSLALAQILEEKTGCRIESLADDNAVFVSLPRLITGDIAALLRGCLEELSTLTQGEKLFRRRLVNSGLFGAAFREAAERSLLLPRLTPGKRIPLWVTRERSRRLFDAVARYDDFPVTSEAWRVCLEDQFDLPGYINLLRDITAGTIGLSFFRRPAPSPFARTFLWKETSSRMYEYDERKDQGGAPAEAGGSRVSLADQIIEEALNGTTGRPPLPETLVRDFCARLRRELPGWTPQDETTLSEWVRERIAIPRDEWETLLEALPPELKDHVAEDPGLGGRIMVLRREGAALEAVVHRDQAEAWAGEAPDFLAPWLRFQGPVTRERITAVFGTREGGARAEPPEPAAGSALTASGPERGSPPEIEDRLRDMEEAGSVIRGVTVTADGAADPVPHRDLICDRENLELLFRLTRKKARPQIREREPALLIPFLARQQGILGGETGGQPWERLRGLTAPAALWESDIFPARKPDYDGGALDRELGRGNLLWFGAGRERLGFAASDELDLIFPPEPAVRDDPSGIYIPTGRYIDAGEPGGSAPLAGLIASGFLDTPREFQEIRDRLQASGPAKPGTPLNAGAGSPPDTRRAAEILWDAVWRGLLSADSFEPVRRGLERGFTLKDTVREAAKAIARRGSRRIPRALRSRPGANFLVSGRWYYLGLDGEDDGIRDPLDGETLNRDRVRLLLDRWGVLARPLLEREEPALSWSRLLPSLRRMELAGEVVAGRFFGGINSLQFARPGIAGELEAAEAERGIYWMNAADPASPAGLDITGLDPEIPSRLPASRLCFRGRELAALSRRNGRDLALYLAAEDPDIPEVLGFLTPGQGRQRIVVERINGKTVPNSPYGAALKALGFLPDRDKLIRYPGL